MPDARYDHLMDQELAPLVPIIRELYSKDESVWQMLQRKQIVVDTAAVSKAVAASEYVAPLEPHTDQHKFAVFYSSITLRDQKTKETTSHDNPYSIWARKCCGRHSGERCALRLAIRSSRPAVGA